MDEKLTKMVHARVTPTLYAKWQELARRARRKPSEILRMLLEDARPEDFTDLVIIEEEES